MKETWCIGVIGLGTIAQRMLACIAGHDRFAVAGGWDPSELARKQAVARVPDLKVAKGAGEILSAAEVDIIYVASPPATHAAHATAALQAGKHVFCEKPLAIDLDEGKALAALAERSDLHCAVNFVHASTPSVQELQQALTRNLAGRVLRADIRLHFPEWPRDWQRNAEWLRFRVQGGFVREVVSHFLYLSERLFGTVRLKQGTIRYPDEPDLAEMLALAEFEAGDLPITLAGSSGGVGPEQIDYTVWGDKRSYRLFDWFRLASSEGGPWHEQPSHLANPAREAQMRQLDSVAAMLDGQPHSLPDFAASLRVQGLVEGLLRG